MSVVVIGAGGHAAVVVDVLRAAGFDPVAATDPDPERQGSDVIGVAVVGSDERLAELRAQGIRQAFVAVGDNALRRRLIARVSEFGFDLVTAVHPSAVVSSSAHIGAGTVLMPGAIVNARARLGQGVIVNTGASIDHDCVVGDCAHIAPGARLGGTVSCGDRVFVGIGACVIPTIAIGEGAVVGAGAAVVRDVPPGATVVGVPARPLR